MIPIHKEIFKLIINIYYPQYNSDKSIDSLMSDQNVCLSFVGLLSAMATSIKTRPGYASNVKEEQEAYIKEYGDGI